MRKYSDYDKVEATINTDDLTSNTPVHLFDVTCVVGSVFSGGEEEPTVAAFNIIANAGHDGTFTFPNMGGKTITVTVETEQ